MKNLKVGLTSKKNLEIIITDDRTTKNTITAFDGNAVDLSNPTSPKIMDSRIADLISTVDKMNQEQIPLEMEVVFYDGEYIEDTLSAEYADMICKIHNAIYSYLYPGDCGTCRVKIQYYEHTYQIVFEFNGSLYSNRIIFDTICRYNLLTYPISDKRTIFDYAFRASCREYMSDKKPTDDKVIALKRFIDSNQYPLFVEQIVKAISNIRGIAEFSWEWSN